MEEDEISDDYHFSDWFEFVKNVKKSRMERELYTYANANLIGNNLKLLFMLKSSLLNFKELLNGDFLLNIDERDYMGCKSIRAMNTLNYYLNFNYDRLKKIKDGDYYTNYSNIIIILDIRPSKPRIFVISKNKCIYSLTSGIIYKKLLMKQKKTKRTEKMLNLMLKATVMKLQRKFIFKKCLIHLKGTRFNISNILVLIEKNFLDKQISIIYSPHISFGRFKFRKIKAIKRRLRKRFSKIIKN